MPKENSSLGPWIIAGAVMLAAGLVAAAIISSRDGSTSSAASEVEDHPTSSSSSNNDATNEAPLPSDDTSENVILTSGIEFPAPPLPTLEFYKPPRTGEWGWSMLPELTKKQQQLLMDYYEAVLPKRGWQLDDLVKDTPQAQFTQVWREPSGNLVELNSWSLEGGPYTFQVYVCPPSDACGTDR